MRPVRGAGSAVEWFGRTMIATWKQYEGQAVDGIPLLRLMGEQRSGCGLSRRIGRRRNARSSWRRRRKRRRRFLWPAGSRPPNSAIRI